MAAQMNPKPGHKMPVNHAMASKSKMHSMGHGVFMDSKGRYHEQNGKFMSTADANKRLGKGMHKPGPMRDSHGRFVKKPPMKRPGMMSKLKARFGHKPKPTDTGKKKL